MIRRLHSKWIRNVFSLSANVGFASINYIEIYLFSKFHIDLFLQENLVQKVREEF